jgi:hypothetical protein
MWLGKGGDGGSGEVIHGTPAAKTYGQELILIVFMERCLTCIGKIF